MGSWVLKSQHNQMGQGSNKFLYLPIFYIWHIWVFINEWVFVGRRLDVRRVGFGIVGTFQDFPVVLHGKPVRDIGKFPSLTYASGFFDGATNRHLGGGGCILYISEMHFYKMKIGCCRSTNTRNGLLFI